ncbi:MAG: hypothetical protein JJE35_05585 [Thermoleophilia bacterium]|nr:hypothetical protein [Thermoleophilia bacterium]
MGIQRRRRGRGFSYEDGDGARVEDEETLARIRALAIPPAWERVWICPDPFGHIQATGFDEAGRKQYRYHERWERRQAARKYEETREFARRRATRQHAGRLPPLLHRPSGLRSLPRRRHDRGLRSP